jgi:hypothetical protein
MNLAELYRVIDSGGYRLTARLVVDAPYGVVTPEIRAALAAYKPLILQRLVSETERGELGRWRGAARRSPTAS